MTKPSVRADDPSAERLRIDKWLWVARFFKTRSLAGEAIARNQVRVAGQRIKASRTVGIGDEILVEKPPYRFEVQVLGISDQRRPAREACLLYAETPDSMAARQALADRLRVERQSFSGLSDAGRPNKKQRRQIIRFQTGGADHSPASDPGSDDR